MNGGVPAMSARLPKGASVPKSKSNSAPWSSGPWSVKLPVSRDFALVFDWAEPTGYGLGRSGWNIHVSTLRQIGERYTIAAATDVDANRRGIVAART